jgi:hypothetical protein
MKLIDDFLVNKTVSVIPRELNQSNIFKFNDLKFMYINPPIKRGKMVCKIILKIIDLKKGSF